MLFSLSLNFIHFTKCRFSVSCFWIINCYYVDYCYNFISLCNIESHFTFGILLLFSAYITDPTSSRGRTQALSFCTLPFQNSLPNFVGFFFQSGLASLIIWNFEQCYWFLIFFTNCLNINQWNITILKQWFDYDLFPRRYGPVGLFGCSWTHGHKLNFLAEEVKVGL